MSVDRSRPPVAAILSPPTDALEQALAAQVLQPHSVSAADRSTLVAELGRALAGGAEWVWVLDASALPRPDALLRLVEALPRAQSLRDRPSLLAGVVLAADGEVDPARAAWYRRAPTQRALEAVEYRVLPIRAAPGPVLIHRRALEQCAGPRTRLPLRGALLEWTARVLATSGGYLVPDSESRASKAGAAPTPGPRTAAALLSCGAFTTTERLGLAFELVEGALGRSVAR